jgi:hypothetical protein
MEMPVAARRVCNVRRRLLMEGTMGYEEAKQQGRAAMALLAECGKRHDEKGHD